MNVRMPLEHVSQIKLPNGDRLLVYEEYHLKQIVSVIIDKNDKTVCVSNSSK